MLKLYMIGRVDNMSKKKISIYVIVIILIIFIGFVGGTYSLEDNNGNLKFELIGPTVVYVDVNGVYEELGINVSIDNKDITDKVIIDSSSVNVNVVGEYMVKYSIDIDNRSEYIYRIVKVVDNRIPQIKLKGEETVYLIVNGSYYEEGYEVSDDKDADLVDNVLVIGNVDTSKVGEYKLEYKVVDSDGNEASVYRNVVVVEPKITLADVSSNKVIYNSYEATRYSNTVVRNRWSDNGFYIEGYYKNGSDNYKIKLKNRDNSLEYVFDMDEDKVNYYKGNISLSLMANGEYDVYILSGDKEERLLNKLNGLSRLLRCKIGKRLVTFNYDNNDQVVLAIEDFSYEYDIVIDPGHGGWDVGAANGIAYEKDMNLMQSMYEKCRYESMGYKVFLTRYDDTYGTLMGNSDLDDLQRRALTMGYYGAVSRITYSNHHNASINSNDHGFEILVSNSLSKDDMVVEMNLYNRYKTFYGIDDDEIRVYSRDYNTDRVYNKINGDVYSYMDYYAVIRIPKELFNVKVVLFEPMYMSNSNDFSWYYTSKKWISVSEIKIQEYVKYLGGTYNEDNSMCL